MSNDEIRILEEAIREINNLRKTNERMSLRLNMFDDLMSTLHGMPARQGGGVEHRLNIAVELNKLIDKFSAPTIINVGGSPSITGTFPGKKEEPLKPVTSEF